MGLMCLLAVHLLQCRSSLFLHPGNGLYKKRKTRKISLSETIYQLLHDFTTIYSSYQHLYIYIYIYIYLYVYLFVYDLRYAFCVCVCVCVCVWTGRVTYSHIWLLICSSKLEEIYSHKQRMTEEMKHFNFSCWRAQIKVGWLVGWLDFIAYQPLEVIQHQILSIYTYIFNQRFQNEY